MRGDGQLVCVGSNHFGQCDVPADLGAVSAVAAGGHHTCAVWGDVQLICVGSNHYGQCDVPADLGAVSAVAAGRFILVQCGAMFSSFALAVITMGSAMCRQIWDLF